MTKTGMVSPSCGHAGGEVVDPGIAAQGGRDAEQNAERRTDQDAESAKDQAGRPGVGQQRQYGFARAWKGTPKSRCSTPYM